MANMHWNRMAAKGPLDPLPQPVGLFKQFVFNDVKTLAIKEKYLALGDTFYCEDAYTKQPVLAVDGAVLTIRKKKTISSAFDKQPLFVLQDKLLTVPVDSRGTDPTTDAELFYITNKLSIGKAKLFMDFINIFDGQKVHLELKGSFFEFSAKIKMGDKIVAEVSRSFLNARELIGGQESFYVSVAPGFDLALAVGFVLALADKEKK